MDIGSTAQLLGNLGEFIGSIAVVVTLVYLAMQIRQNTTALTSSTWQAIQNAEQAFDQAMATNRGAAEAWVRGAADGLDSLEDPAERFQCFLIGKQLVDLFQTHHYQHERGLVDAELWQTWVSQFEYEIQTSPGFGDVLRERYPHLRPSFRRFVDEHAPASTGLPTGTDRLP